MQDPNGAWREEGALFGPQTHSGDGEAHTEEPVHADAREKHHAAVEVDEEEQSDAFAEDVAEGPQLASCWWWEEARPARRGDPPRRGWSCRWQCCSSGASDNTRTTAGRRLNSGPAETRGCRTLAVRSFGSSYSLDRCWGSPFKSVDNSEALIATCLGPKVINEPVLPSAAHLTDVYRWRVPHANTKCKCLFNACVPPVWCKPL